MMIDETIEGKTKRILYHYATFRFCSVCKHSICSKEVVNCKFNGFVPKGESFEVESDYSCLAWEVRGN